MKLLKKIAVFVLVYAFAIIIAVAVSPYPILALLPAIILALFFINNRSHWQLIATIGWLVYGLVEYLQLPTNQDNEVNTSTAIIGVLILPALTYLAISKAKTMPGVNLPLTKFASIPLKAVFVIIIFLVTAFFSLISFFFYLASLALTIIYGILYFKKRDKAFLWLALLWLINTPFAYETQRLMKEGQAVIPVHLLLIMPGALVLTVFLFAKRAFKSTKKKS